MDTFDELCDTILLKVDMLELIELLNISTKDIIRQFEDEIMMNRDEIEEYLDELTR
jgi:hypothetical protein